MKPNSRSYTLRSASNCRARFFGQSLRSLSHARRKFLVEPNQEHGLSIARQCELLSISRSAYYYCPTGESPLGSRQMARHLRRQGFGVSRKRIGRLMRLMGFSPIYQKPNTSKPHLEHKIYPYLLRGVTFDRPNRVWCADISYVPMRRGFLYLVAIMD